MIPRTVKLAIFPAALAVTSFLVPLASVGVGIACGESLKPCSSPAPLQVPTTFLTSPLLFIPKSFSGYIAHNLGSPASFFIMSGINAALWGLASFAVLWALTTHSSGRLRRR